MGCERGQSLFVPIPRLRDVVRRADAAGLEVGPLLRPWVHPDQLKAHPTNCRPGMHQAAPGRGGDFGFSRRCTDCLDTPQGEFWYRVRDRAVETLGVTHVLTVATEKLRGLLRARHPVNARALDSAFGYYRRVVEMTHEDGDHSPPSFWLNLLRRWLDEGPDIDGVQDRDLDFLRHLADQLEAALTEWETFLAEVPAPAHAVWTHAASLSDRASLFAEDAASRPRRTSHAPGDGGLLAYVRVNEAARNASEHNHYPTPADVVLCLALERDLIHSRGPMRERAQYVHTYAADLPLPPPGWPGLEVLPAPTVGRESDREVLMEHAFNITAADRQVPFGDVLTAVAAAHA